MPTTRIPYGVLDGRYVNTMGDTMIGILTLSGAPTSDLHAATKKYVDDAVSVGGHTHALSAGATDVTATAAEVNLLDLSGLSVGQVLRATGAAAASWASIQAGDLPAGIDVAKLADGSVSNTEYQYLNGVTSSIQTQLNAKAADSDVLKKDGSVSLTADWDIGDGRKLKGDELAARDSAGLKLYDDGGSGIFIKDGGNVGIGTANPGSPLTVVGDTNIGDGAMFFDSGNSRLGINTTTPQVSVDVNGWTGIPGNMYSYDHMSVAADLFAGGIGSGVGRLRVSSNASGGFMMWNTYYSSSYDSRAFDTGKPAFQMKHDGLNDAITFSRAPATTGAQSFSELMRIQGNGRIGIGTGSPYRKAEILDNSGPQLRLTHIYGSYVTDLQTTSSGYFYINPSGKNVGIGTANPGYRLQIESDIHALLSISNTQATSDRGAYINLQTGSASRGYIGIGKALGGTATIFANEEANSLGIRSEGALHLGSSGDSIRMTIQTDGNTGLGTTGPDRKLEILDSSNSQLRLTHTSGSVYTDFQTDSSGHLTIDPTGGEMNVDAIVDFTASMGNSAKDPTSDAPADWIEVKVSGTSYYVPVYTAS